MRVIIPMAGLGKRLRPHTLTTAKPLLPIAGKPIVQRLTEDIAKLYKGQITDIVYITGQFGAEVEAMLLQVADTLGATGHIRYQDKPLGTAHAVACAGDLLADEIVIAFADTLFRADFELDRNCEGVIWVQQVADPRAFGVVTLNSEGIITDMIEKPDTFVSDLAIIGIYYIRQGEVLKKEIQYLIDNRILGKGEYQLTDALSRMRQAGARFKAGKVDHWWDCGNKQALLDTNAQVLNFLDADRQIHTNAIIENSIIIPPCYIGPDAHIYNSVVGPYVSVSAEAKIHNSVVNNTIIREQAHIYHACVSDSILGRYSQHRAVPAELDLGDYSKS
jgi:glucose-1-phosphate thymidylyltransferase